MINSSFRYIRELVATFFRLSRPRDPYPVMLGSSKGKVRGHVLFSYLTYPLLLSDNDIELKGHSNRWECREIARIFTRLGFAVDGINFKDNLFNPSKDYDIFFDISTNMQRLAPLIGPRALKILHRTGSDAFFQNKAEMQRVNNLEERRSKLYSPRRIVAYPDLERKSLHVADYCSLIGNQNTLATYPDELRSKIRLINVSGSDLGSSAKQMNDLVPSKREFVSFCGGGMVHKGVDLLLEVFASCPQYTLNVIGPTEGEEDFCRIYERELFRLPNIRCHGFLKPSSEQFLRVIRDSFCFIAPSCSEGMSSAVITCIQAGLYPIISEDCGVSLPKDCGINLYQCSKEEIISSIDKVYKFDSDTLKSQIMATQSWAGQICSRDCFSRAMSDFIADAVGC